MSLTLEKNAVFNVKCAMFLSFLASYCRNVRKINYFCEILLKFARTFFRKSGIII